MKTVGTLRFAHPTQLRFAHATRLVHGEGHGVTIVDALVVPK
jgi:hypothetical protein